MAHFAIFVVLVVNVTVLDQNLAENDGREVEEQHVSVVDVPRSSDFNEEIRKREVGPICVCSVLYRTKHETFLSRFITLEQYDSDDL